MYYNNFNFNVRVVLGTMLSLPVYVSTGSTFSRFLIQVNIFFICYKSLVLKSIVFNQHILPFYNSLNLYSFYLLLFVYICIVIGDFIMKWDRDYFNRFNSGIFVPDTNQELDFWRHIRVCFFVCNDLRVMWLIIFLVFVELSPTTG